MNETSQPPPAPIGPPVPAGEPEPTPGALPRVGWGPVQVLIGLMAWIVSPIDLIPEFIPVLGPMDDVVVAVVAMRYVRRRVGVEDLRMRWAGTPEGFALLVRIIGST